MKTDRLTSGRGFTKRRRGGGGIGNSLLPFLSPQFRIGLVITCIGSVLSLSAQVVTIPDPGLLSAIRLALNKPIGDITQADMASLNSLKWELQGVPIQSLQGLELASNIKSLEFSQNFITNITPLASLSHL